MWRVHRLRRDVVCVYRYPRRYYAMLRNDAMTSMDRLQPGLFFCLCTRPRKFGTEARSDAVCRSHRSQALFRGEWLRLQSRKASMTDRTQPEITPNTPLRLADAVKVVFAMG